MRVKDLFLTGFVLMYPVIGVGTGFLYGASFDVQPRQVEQPSKVDVRASGEKFALKEKVFFDGEEVAGVSGNPIMISSSLNDSPLELYDTCVHEVILHNRAGYIHEENESERWIEQVENTVVSPTCLEFLYRLDGGDEVAT